MKTFEIYRNFSGVFTAVKVGWSWPGFFFGIFWSLVKRLWTLSLIILAVALVLGTLPSDWALLLQILVACVIGYNGNKWLGKKLLNTGHELIGTIDAENGQIAIWKAVLINNTSPRKINF